MAQLSGGRVLISRAAHIQAFSSIVSALRYGLVRTQFGKPENKLMDYPLHQFRLLTRLATHIIQMVGSTKLAEIWKENMPNLLNEKNKTNMLCHGLSSACKAFGSWDAQDTHVEGRKACGGMGFSRYAMFGQNWADGDPNTIGEGDNHILLNETA